MAEIYRVNEAREAGVSDNTILKELRSLNEELGNPYKVDDAFKAGVSLNDISNELGEIRLNQSSRTQTLQPETRTDTATLEPIQNEPLTIEATSRLDEQAPTESTSVLPQEVKEPEQPQPQPQFESGGVSENVDQLLLKTTKFNNAYPFLFGDDLKRALNEAPDLNPADIIALSGAETSFGKKLKSVTDVQGIMQVTNNTGKEEFQLNNIGREFDVNSSRDQFLAGSLHLKRHLNTFNGDYDKAIAAYNAGAGTVRQAEKLAEQNGTDWINELSNTQFVKERNQKNKEIIAEKNKDRPKNKQLKFTPKEKEITGLIERFKENKEFLGEFNQKEFSPEEMARFEDLMRDGIPLTIEMSVDKEKMLDRALLEKEMFQGQSEEVQRRDNAIRDQIIKQQEYIRENPDVEQQIKDLEAEESILHTGLLGLAQGLDMTGANIGNITRAIGGATDIEILKNLGDKIYDHYSLRPAMLARPKILERESGVGQWKKLSYWTHAIGQQIPIMAMMIGTGGLSGKVATGFGKKVLGKHLTEKGIQNLAHWGMAAGGGLSAGSFEGASLYRDMLESGFSEGEALLGGTYATGLSTGLNSLGFSKILKALPSDLKGKIGRRVISGMTEAWTEILETPASMVAEEMAGRGRQYSNLIEDMTEAIQKTYEVGGPSFLMGLFLAGKIETRPDYDKVIAEKVEQLQNYIGSDVDINKAFEQAGVTKWFLSPTETPLEDVLKQKNPDEYVIQKDREYYQEILKNTEEVEGKDPKELDDVGREQLIRRQNAKTELENLSITQEEIPGEASQEPVLDSESDAVKEGQLGETLTPAQEEAVADPETVPPAQEEDVSPTPEQEVAPEETAVTPPETAPQENAVQNMDEDAKNDFKLKLRIQLQRNGRSKEQAEAEAEELSNNTTPQVVSLLNAYVKDTEIRGRERLETDELTSLKNSRFLKAKDEDGNLINGKPIKRKNSKGETIELFVPKDGLQLFLDIDDFGAFNKKYDQIAGDEVLATVGALMNQNFGSLGTPVRIGGEELAVIFNEGVTPEQVMEADKAMRKSLSEMDVRGENITYSAGISNTFEGANAGEQQAKTQGKNQTVVGETVDGTTKTQPDQEVSEGSVPEGDIKGPRKPKPKSQSRKPAKQTGRNITIKRLGDQLKSIRGDLKGDVTPDEKSILKTQEQQIISALKQTAKKRLESERLVELRKEVKRIEKLLGSKLEGIDDKRRERARLEEKLTAVMNSIAKEEEAISKEFKEAGLESPIDEKTGSKTQKKIRREELAVDRKGSERITDEQIQEAKASGKTKKVVESLAEDKEKTRVTSEIDAPQAALERQIDRVKKEIEKTAKQASNIRAQSSELDKMKSKTRKMEAALQSLKKERNEKFIDDPFQEEVDRLEKKGIKLVQQIRKVKSKIRSIDPNRPTNKLFELQDQLFKLENERVNEDETISKFINEKDPDSDIDVVQGSSPPEVLTQSQLRRKAFEADRQYNELQNVIVFQMEKLESTKDPREKNAIRKHIGQMKIDLNVLGMEREAYLQGKNPRLNDYMEKADLTEQQKRRLKRQGGFVRIPSVNDGVSAIEAIRDFSASKATSTWQFIKTALGGNIKAQKIMGVEFQRLNNKKRSLEFLAQKEIIKITDNLSELEAELIPFLIEKTEVPAELNRPDLEGLYELYNSDSQLKTRLDNAVKSVRSYFNTMFNFMKNGDKNFNANQIEDYVTHIWGVKKEDKQKAVKWLGKKFDTENPFSQERFFKTYKEGIEAGFIPKQLSIAHIMDIHAKYAIRTIANQQFIEMLQSIEHGDTPLIILQSEAFGDDGKVKPEYRHYRNIGNNNFAQIVDDVSEKGKRIKRVDHYLYNPDIEPAIKVMFETWEPGPIFNAIRSINAYFKTVNLSWSLFHHNALIETAVATLGLKKTKEIVSDMNAMLESIENKNYVALRNVEMTEDFINHGGQMGSVIDADLPIIEKGIEKVKEFQEKHGIPGKGLVEMFRVANEANNRILWDWLHNSLKIHAYNHIVKNDIENNYNIQGADNKQLAKMNAAQFVNDTFGGQVWENLMFSPKTMAYANQILLSPDWFLSTMRQALSATGFGTVAGLKTGKKLRSNLGKKFWMRAALYFGIGANLLNMALRAWDEEEGNRKKTKKINDQISALRAEKEELKNKRGIQFSRERDAIDDEIKELQSKVNSKSDVMDKLTGKEWWKYTMFGNTKGHGTHIFTGRYRDGEERYLRFGKQFRELPEMFYDFHMGELRPNRALVKKVGGKLSPIFNVTSMVMWQKTIGGFKDVELEKSKKEDDMLKYGFELSKRILALSAPFVAQGIANEYKQFTWTDLFAQSSKGMTLDRAKTMLIKSAMEDGKHLAKIRQGMVRNNINWVEAQDAAINELKKRVQKEAVKKAEDHSEKPKTLGEEVEKVKRQGQRITAETLAENAEGFYDRWDAKMLEYDVIKKMYKETPPSSSDNDGL